MRVKREVRGVADARRRRFGVREPAQGSSRTRQRARLIHTQARSMETPASKGISLKFEPHRFETGIFSEHAHRELEVFLIKRGRLRVASHHRLRNDINPASRARNIRQRPDGRAGNSTPQMHTASRGRRVHQTRTQTTEPSRCLAQSAYTIALVAHRTSSMSSKRSIAWVLACSLSASAPLDSSNVLSTCLLICRQSASNAM